MNVWEVLQTARNLHIAFRQEGRRVCYWAPNTLVPRGFASAVSRHREELLGMLARAEISVCSSPRLHAQYWGPFAGYYTCLLCSRFQRHGLEEAQQTGTLDVDCSGGDGVYCTEQTQRA